ncbi:MAG: hypothetical protein ACE5GK_05020 [Nitrospiria bacterium]
MTMGSLRMDWPRMKTVIFRDETAPLHYGHANALGAMKALDFPFNLL